MPAWAVPAYDTSGSCSDDGGAATTCNISITVGASNPAMVGFIAIRSSSITASSFTWNSVACTADTAVLSLYSSIYLRIYKCTAPASGAHTGTCTVSGAGAQFACALVSVTGAHQSSAFGTQTTSNPNDVAETSTSLNVTSDTTELVITGIAIGNSDNNVGTLTATGTGQTERIDTRTGDLALGIGAATQTGAATTTSSWTLSASNGNVQASISVKPAAAAATRRPMAPIVFQ